MWIVVALAIIPYILFIIKKMFSFGPTQFVLWFLLFLFYLSACTSNSVYHPCITQIEVSVMIWDFFSVYWLLFYFYFECLFYLFFKALFYADQLLTKVPADMQDTILHEGHTGHTGRIRSPVKPVRQITGPKKFATTVY